MSSYRRAFTGTSYFFTVVTHDRGPILCDEPVRQALRSAIKRVRLRLPFQTDAMVLMPNHLHCIWTLPDGDTNFSTRWSQIKHDVSYMCRDLYPASLSRSRQRQREAPIWQRRFWEHQLHDEHDMERHIDYIHFNPVKHGLIQAASAWTYSTFARYVREGIYAPDWGGNPECEDMRFE
ncbi:REP-associated tyrosine transposase [Telluria aromaticivorans]|uniref:Transposase n=1 Tax=Telluria aromaticivorans TaxID=2725995 RepID=A0A7Y2JXS5_9BURK|nr:transposase [Telluria aromaticivorans]NNG22688.1 transposase [Telluria aromaticivorans]